MKTVAAIILLASSVLCQPSIVFPVENTYYPGNSQTKFAGYYGIPLGTVIDNCPPVTINSLSYRPSFSAGYATTIYSAQAITIVIRMSSGYMDTWSMTGPDCVDKANTFNPLGQNGTVVSFPSTRTAYPTVGLQAILSEPFLLKIPFTFPYIHPGGSLQMFMGWPFKTDNQEIATIDSDVVGDPYGSASGYTHMGNYSLSANSSYPYYCYLAIPPRVYTRGQTVIPSETYIEAHAANTLGAVLFLSTNLIGQRYNWIGMINTPCSVIYDLNGAISIPFTGTISFPIGLNTVPEKSYLSSLVVGQSVGWPYTSVPTVITVPTTYPARYYKGNLKHVPSIRSMEPNTQPTDWLAVVTGIN